MKYTFWHSATVNPTMIHIQIQASNEMYLYTQVGMFTRNAFTWNIFIKNTPDRIEIPLKEFCEKYLLNNFMEEL